MNALRSIVLAFSLFSIVPCPHARYEASSMRYLMAAFPLVGCVLGPIVAAWLLLCALLEAGAQIAGAGCVLITVVFTGGIHLDGFCDVVDALASRAEPARKRAILNDPHIGAFAVIACASWFLGSFALWSETTRELAMRVLPNEPFGGLSLTGALSIVALAFALSRIATGIATTIVARAGSTGMVALFQEAGERRPVLIALVLELLGSLAAVILISAPCAAALAAAALGSLGVVGPFARRQFGGMSGDVAGFFLCLLEPALIAVVLAALKAGAL